MKNACLYVFAILLFLLLTSSLPGQVTCESTGATLVIRSRTSEYVFDVTRGILKNVYFIFERRTEVYRYENDGFDVVVDSSPLRVLDYELSSDAKGNLHLFFFHEKGVVKELIFVDGPHYIVKLNINTPVEIKVHLPRLYYDRFWDNMFMSYSRSKRVIIFKMGSTKGVKEIFNNVVALNGRLEAKGYLGPLKYSFISAEFPDDYEKLKVALRSLPKAWTWYGSIFYGLVSFMSWLYRITGNFGWAIIIFTIIVRLILYPLYHTQMKSMIKMKELQPYVERLKKKYKDPRRLQEALMELYREKKVNPASGCLTLLVQFPIFLLLFSVIRYFGEEFAYGPPFFIWKDLSVGGFKENILFVVISVVCYFYSALITSQDRRTAWQSIAMSIIFPFLFIRVPSGLFLYWTVQTIIQLLVTLYIYKRYNIKGMTIKELFGG